MAAGFSVRSRIARVAETDLEQVAAGLSGPGPIDRSLAAVHDQGKTAAAFSGPALIDLMAADFAPIGPTGPIGPTDPTGRSRHYASNED